MAGTLAGQVVDIRNYQPIEGATVTAQPGDHTTTTGGDGTYSLSIDAGSHDLTIGHAGYDPFDASGIVVLDDVTTEINAALWPTEY